MGSKVDQFFSPIPLLQVWIWTEMLKTMVVELNWKNKTTTQTPKLSKQAQLK